MPFYELNYRKIAFIILKYSVHFFKTLSLNIFHIKQNLYSLNVLLILVKNVLKLLFFQNVAFFLHHTTKFTISFVKKNTYCFRK